MSLAILWKHQHAFALIDLSNDFFIARFSNKQDYDVALLKDPGIITNHYLHVQRRVPNFMLHAATIDSLLVWVEFPELPMGYYNGKWLERAGNKFGRTTKVDRTTLVT